jgi:hypothetical protein
VTFRAPYMRILLGFKAPVTERFPQAVRSGNTPEQHRYMLIWIFESG